MNRTASNEDRTNRQAVLFDKRRQMLVNLGLARGADDVGDGRKEARPLTPFDCTRRRYRGGRLFAERDGSDSDGDVDDALSEFATGYYPPRWRAGRPSKMRSSTLKKLNLLFDGMGSPLASSSHAQSAPEGTDEEEVRASLERTPVADPPQKVPVEAPPKEPSESPEPGVSEVVPPGQPIQRPTRSSTVGLWCLRKLMTMLLVLFELLLKLTIKVLAYLRGLLQTALHTLWDQHMYPLLSQAFRERLPELNPKSVVLVIVIAPLLALLAMAYCVVCALYWLNQVLLMEAN